MDAAQREAIFDRGVGGFVGLAVGDAAFTWLTSPYVGRATWTDENQTSIVIRPQVA